MTRPEVRAAVDAAIRRHLAARRAVPPADGPRPVAPPRAEQQAGGAVAECAPGPPPLASSGPHGRPGTELGSTSSGAPGPPPASSEPHASHGRFPRAARPGDPPEGRCVIEPEAECVGSGYCRSHGY